MANHQQNEKYHQPEQEYPEPGTSKDHHFTRVYRIWAPKLLLVAYIHLQDKASAKDLVDSVFKEVGKDPRLIGTKEGYIQMIGEIERICAQ